MSLLIKEQLANPGNYGDSRGSDQIKYLVIHYTGNDGDNAANNAAYYQRTVVEASAHYFVDDTTVYRSVPDLRVAWAVGGTKWSDCGRTGGGTLYGVVTNTNSISIELCDTRRDGTYQATEATLANAVVLCRELMVKYRIPLERVVRHFDVTGKHCPVYMMNPVAWADFKALMGETDNMEDDMDISKWSDEDIRRLMNRMQQVAGSTAVGETLGPELREAMDRGITDGSSPNAFCTRAQAAVMTLRAITNNTRQ